MIPLPFGSWWKKFEAGWWARQEARLRLEYAEKERSLHADLEAKLAATRGQLEADHAVLEDQVRKVKAARADLEDQERRLSDRQEELLRVTEEVRTQLRLIEAKAHPDSVWVAAFTAGVTKSWDTILPLLQDRLRKTQETLEQHAIDATLDRLGPTLSKRRDIEAKRAEFQGKRDRASGADKARYDHYLEVITWVLNGHRVHPDES